MHKIFQNVFQKLGLSFLYTYGRFEAKLRIINVRKLKCSSFLNKRLFYTNVGSFIRFHFCLFSCSLPKLEKRQLVKSYICLLAENGCIYNKKKFQLTFVKYGFYFTCEVKKYVYFIRGFATHGFATHAVSIFSTSLDQKPYLTKHLNVLFARHVDTDFLYIKPACLLTSALKMCWYLQPCSS